MEGSKVSSQSSKRPFEQVASNMQDSPYYKVRALLKDLRPHFIEILKTPDFQNSKAAGSIREGMKDLIDLYKVMISESSEHEKRNNPPDYSSPNIPNWLPTNHQKDLKPTVELFDQQPRGSYIIGGSAIGRNFIMFKSNRAIYYGQTKEDFRAANPKSSKGERRF